MKNRGLLIIVSAPSGAGKGSVLLRAFERDGRLKHSLSATTREPREDEIPGEHYEFIDEETFQQWIGDDRFLEWAEVHGNFYGTLHDRLRQLIASGHDIILELDVQGMRSVKALRDDVLAVFIMPPSLAELEMRIRARGGLSEGEIKTRLHNAQVAMEARDEYDHVIVNDDLATAIEDFLIIVKNERRRLEIG